MPPSRSPLLARILAVLTILAGGSAPAQTVPTIQAYVVLQEEPAAALAARRPTGRSLAGEAPRLRAHARALQSSQDALEPRLAALGARITGRFTRVAHAVRVRLPETRLADLAALPGVRAVHRARILSPHLATVVPFIGAPQLWQPAPGLPGADGRGVRIGIIDSGIDYLHAHFGGPGDPAEFTRNDPTRIEPGSFPTTKVVGGFDFAGDAYDAADERHDTPVPDPDPLDCAGNGHGTHVAGIASGLGVLTHGNTFAGDYATLADFTDFRIAPGVAPGAQLYALKVFGCSGSTALVTEALEWAADPNGDYDFSDRLDVVNLSLGGDFGSIDPEDTDVAAVNRLVELGAVVVCAAGNGDNVFYAVSSPGVASRAITVANSITRGDGPALEVTAPASVAGLYPMIEGALTPPLPRTNPVEGRLVQAQPNLACDSLANASDLAGNIALIDRGTCFFSTKILAAQAAGAVAVVMVNNLDADPIPMGGDSAGIRIPAVMISLADGNRLKARLDDDLRVRLDPSRTLDRPALVDTLADSSSRGPGSPDNGLKPDLAAPGTGIHSADSGSGTGGTTLSGTSMAAPVVAGAVALLRQRHPEWPPATLKAALMNTAKPMRSPEGDPYPESRTGAGRAQPALADRTPVTAAAHTADGAVGISFGALVLAAPHRESRQVLLTNHTAQTATYRVAFSHSVTQEGVRYQPSPATVTAPPHGTALVTLELIADPAQFTDTPDPTTLATVGAGTPLPRHFLYEASGQLEFLGTPDPATPGSSAPPDLHLPCYANVRAASDYRLTAAQVRLPDTASTQATPEFTLRFVGTQASDRLLPIVSAFQLGDTSPDKRLADPNRAASDLLAVGTATDHASAGSLEDSTVFFGIATAGPFTSPQPYLGQIFILVDVDGDTWEDYVVANGTGASTNTGGSEDTFMTVVYELNLLGRVSATNAVAYLNHYAADEAETAPFNNSVLVLPVPAAQLGLASGASAFRYQVITYATSGSVDRTGWIPFDPARPILDASFATPDGTPMNDDGLPLRVRVDREAAFADGVRLPRLLLLHHHGLRERRLEIATLDLGNDDTDADRMPDWWEQRHFGNLSRAGLGTDTDGDGAPDSHELDAGTNPTDPGSLFRLRSASRVSARNIAVRWSGPAGRTYALERTTDLANGSWTVVRDGIEATPPVNSLTDTNAPAPGPYFYRVRLE